MFCVGTGVVSVTEVVHKKLDALSKNDCGVPRTEVSVKRDASQNGEGSFPSIQIQLLFMLISMYRRVLRWKWSQLWEEQELSRGGGRYPEAQLED